MSNTAPGFAIRRNTSCLASETDCGGTLAPFRGCCPSPLACPQQYNVACCPSGQNCTAEIAAAPQPRCANATWDLYDNGGLFCCEHGQSAYDRGNTNVCAWPGAQLRDGDRVLQVVREGQSSGSVKSSSTPGVVSLTPLPTIEGIGTLRIDTLSASMPSGFTFTQPTPTSLSGSGPSGSSSSSHPGAIVGGVVGGVAFLGLILFAAWYLLHLRKSRKAVKNPYLPNQRHEMDASNTKFRVDAQQVVYEARGTTLGDLQARELHAHQKPVELPAEVVNSSRKA